jgi:glyoxylase-like metal-dependent hydrolase (beta-lactamase superfamily II)
VKELAPDVWQIRGFPVPNSINAYLLGDVLVDASHRRAGKSILKQLDGHKVTAHALTHGHADHQGSSHEICEALGIPFWAPEGEADIVEDPEHRIRELYPDSRLGEFFIRVFVGPGHPVDRRLEEGDGVAGFKVIDAPGHSPGQVVFWRESDRVLIIGDVLNNMDVITGLPGLREPKGSLTPDPAENRRSARKLGALEPELVCFGHGAPLRDPRKFTEFVSKLPD